MLLRTGVNKDQQCSAFFNLWRLPTPPYTFRPCFRECTAHVVATTEEKHKALHTMTNWKKTTKDMLMQKGCCIWPEWDLRAHDQRRGDNQHCNCKGPGLEAWARTLLCPSVRDQQPPYCRIIFSHVGEYIPCPMHVTFGPILPLTIYSWLKWAQIAPWPGRRAGRDCLGKNAWDPVGEAYVI